MKIWKRLWKRYSVFLVAIGILLVVGIIAVTGTKLSARSERKKLLNEIDTLQKEIDTLNEHIDNLEAELEVRASATKRKQELVSQPPQKMVALTFDDGPGQYTEKLLDALQEHNIKATFFVLGECAEKYPEVIQRMADEGHEIANHCYVHNDLTQMSYDKMVENIQKTVTVVEDITDGQASPTMLRPPGGAYDDNVQKATREMGHKIILWSLDTLDWRYRDETSILNHVYAADKSSIQDGSIILMHDIYDTTVNAAIEVIEHLSEEGFTAVTVSEMLDWRADGGVSGEVYNSLPLKTEDNQ